MVIEEPQPSADANVPQPKTIASECAESSFGHTGTSSHGNTEGDENVDIDNDSRGDNSSTNSPGRKLPLRVKILLGIGESVQGIYVVIGGYYLNTFLLETSCIDPMYVGLIQAIQGVFDAINDPLIGRMSDRTRTRWGRRRPWLLFAAPVLALFYFALWNTLPLSTPQWVKFVYALTVSMGVSAGITSIQVQIGALVPELTDDYDERTSVSAFRLFLGNLIGFIAALSHNQIVNHQQLDNVIELKVAHRYRISGAVFAVVMWASAWITFFGVRERFKPRQETRKTMSLKLEVKAVMRNKGFICVVGAYLCGPTAIVLIQGNIFMFCKYIIRDPRLINKIIPAVQGTALASMPIWVLLSRRYGKKALYLIGGSVLFAATLGIFWVEDSFSALVISFILGLAGPIPYLVPYSMLPDVIEEDELRTGKRREGIFVGLFTIVLKLSVSGALTITNFILKAGGYRAPTVICGKEEPSDLLPDTQPEVVLNFLRVLCGPLPSIFFLGAMVFVWAFPISRSKQLAMAKLAAQARLERLTEKSETSSVTSTHSPRDVKELSDLVDGPFQEEIGTKALEAMIKEYTEVKFEEYVAQYQPARISQVHFEDGGRPEKMQEPAIVVRKPAGEELEKTSVAERSKASVSTDEPSSAEQTEGRTDSNSILSRCTIASI